MGSSPAIPLPHLAAADPPSRLAEALARVQAELPQVQKDRTAKVKGKTKDGVSYEYEYKYADLASVSATIMPLLGRNGLAFTARPTLADGHLVLAYSLLHSSGEREDGLFPIRNDGSPQQVGGLITYARRYCLCAVTGIAAEDDTDAQDAPQPAAAAKRQRGKPPERAAGNLPRNADGSVSRSRATDDELDASGNMTAAQLAGHSALQKGASRGAVPGTERLTAPDPDDPWADAPAPGLRVPSPAPNRVGVIQAHFKRIGVTDREERLGYTADIIGRKVGSTSELHAQEGIALVKVIEKCRDVAALNAALQARDAGEPAGDGDVSP